MHISHLHFSFDFTLFWVIRIKNIIINQDNKFYIHQMNCDTFSKQFKIAILIKKNQENCLKQTIHRFLFSNSRCDGSTLDSQQTKHALIRDKFRTPRPFGLQLVEIPRLNRHYIFWCITLEVGNLFFLHQEKINALTTSGHSYFKDTPKAFQC